MSGLILLTWLGGTAAKVEDRVTANLRIFKASFQCVPWKKLINIVYNSGQNKRQRGKNPPNQVPSDQRSKSHCIKKMNFKKLYQIFYTFFFNNHSIKHFIAIILKRFLNQSFYIAFYSNHSMKHFIAIILWSTL